MLLAEGIKLGGPLWDTMYGMQLVDPDSPGFDLNRMVSWAMLARRHKHLGSPKTKPRFKLQTWKREFICANFREEGKKCYGKGKPALQGAGKGDKRICKKCVIARFQQELQAWEKASIDYNRQDAAVLLPIQSKQRVILAQRGQLDLFETMMDVLQHVLLPMQIRGLETDPKVRIELTNEYKQKSETYQQEWDALTGGVNESSTPQMRKLVYETWRLPTQYKMKKDKKTGGRIRTVALDNEAIENLVALEDTPQKYRDGLRLLQRLKQAKKWYETYVDCGQRIFPRYGPAKKEGSGSVRAAAMAATGRIIAKGGDNADGSKTPPIQQFPEPMKRLIIPDRGLFLALDYSQEELRIIAYLANDEKLIHMIETGEDIHAANAEAFGCDRTRAKNLFYGAIYGAKPRALVHELRAHGFDLTMDDASNFLRLARKLYPQVFAWHDQICQQADRLHYITDPFGGRRNFAARDTRYSEVLNFPVQSTGSRMQWLRLREIYDAARARESDLSILQFDSIVLDTSKERVLDLAAVMKEILERPFPQVHPKFYCPVDIKVGPNWGDMEKLVI